MMKIVADSEPLVLLECLVAGTSHRPNLEKYEPKMKVGQALRVVREARQIHGGMGIIGKYLIMRHMLNLESVITYRRHPRYPLAHHGGGYYGYSGV